MTIAERQLRSNLLGRVISGIGFAKGSLILSMSVKWRRELATRKQFKLKEMKQRVTEEHEWRR